MKLKTCKYTYSRRWRDACIFQLRNLKNFGIITRFQKVDTIYIHEIGYFMKILKGPLYRESVHLCVLKCVQQFATYNAISLAADSMGGHIVCCSVNSAFFTNTISFLFKKFNAFETCLLLFGKTICDCNILN